MVKSVAVVACLTILLSLSGCSPSAEPTTPSPQPTPTAMAVTVETPTTATAVTATVTQSLTTTPITPTLPTVPPLITLTLWTAEPFSPAQADASGQILGQQIEAFTAAHTDVVVEYVLKKPYGKGGILDYLLTTAAVVPDLLPDLAFLDVD